MSTGLTQRSSSANNRAKPLQLSTNTIHTKIPKRIDNVVHDKVGRPGKEILDLHSAKEALSTVNRKLTKIGSSKSCKTPKVDENDIGQVTIKNIESTTLKTASVEKVDENDVSNYIKNAYDPLQDIHPLDEELYQKILKLELADDGLPSYDFEEPFDF